MTRHSADFLAAVSERILTGVGTPAPIARRVAEVLVNANLAGHDSHGVIRLPDYLDAVDRRALVPAAEPEITRCRGGVAVMDGKHGWGHWAVDRAMAWCIERARETGLAAVSLYRAGHTGRMGEYCEVAARAGCASLIMAGLGGRGAGSSAPLGGRERALGPNPVAMGAPAGDGPPFILDYATTVVAQGKVKVAQSRGEALPPGLVLDAEGRPSTRPEDLFAGGTLAFFGGHKGYALSLATCLFGGLSGAFQREPVRIGGILIQAMDVEAFQSRRTYEDNVRRFLSSLKSGPLAPGAAEILVPGEPEWRTRHARLRDGVEIPDGVWAEIIHAALRRGITLPSERP